MKGVTPSNGQRVIGFYEDGENSFVQLCYYNEEEEQWYGVGGSMPDEQTGCPDFWIEKPIENDGPASMSIQKNYTDEIILYQSEKENGIIEKAGFSFDENGECAVQMNFGDGIAVSLDGKLEMTYPTMEEVKCSSQMQAEITDYTGRHEINQYDIALKYGKVKLPASGESSKYCLFCGSELNYMGNADGNQFASYDDDDSALISHFICPTCGRSYEVCDPTKEDREGLYKDYWDKH